MLELRKFVAPEFVFGQEARKLAVQYAINFGAKKLMIVTDPGILKAGWAEEISDSFITAGIDCILFSQVTPNPRSDEVMTGAELYHSENCDLIVAIGGGSPIDCAKGIGIVCTNHRSILEFEGIDNVDIPGPPLICIPTTAGTSADVSQFAIINNVERKIKIAIISKTMVPDVALIDPETTLSMDLHLTACTGIDALVHAIEAYVSTASGPITDIHAVAAIVLIHENLLRVLESPNDLMLRSEMMLASLEAGLAFSNASLGAVHAMAHSLGGLLDLPHGECNALLLEHVVAFNFGSATKRYCRIAECFGIDTSGKTESRIKHALLDRIHDLREAAGIRNTLEQCGVSQSDISLLARNAVNDPCMVTNPCQPTIRDIERIYESAR
jgi:alcohol dehydrogenase